MLRTAAGGKDVGPLIFSDGCFLGGYDEFEEQVELGTLEAFLRGE
ncbi:hypothetical protein ACFVZ3_34525 [Kitasatospora purpeofusca]